MKSFTKNFLLFIKITLPSVFCLLSFKLFNIDIGYHVLFFGIIIILFNLNKAKFNYIVSFISSIGLSYLVFFISIGLYFGIGYILMQFIELDKLEEVSLYGYNLKNFMMMLPISIFSPILIFLFYKFLFKMNKSNYSKTITWATIIILIIYGIIINDFEDENSSAFWQFIMVLALQLLLYQNELKSLFKPKNE